MSDRLVVNDHQATALARIAAQGRGVVLVPAKLPPIPSGTVDGVSWSGSDWFALERGDLATAIGGRTCVPLGVQPYPAVGCVLYVAEGWQTADRVEYGSSGTTILVGAAAVFRARGDHKFHPARPWRPARELPAQLARTRFRVLSRWALRLGEVTEEMAAGMGMPPVGHQFEGPPPAYGWTGDVADALPALAAWWPKWHGAPWIPDAWAFAAAVEVVRG